MGYSPVWACQQALWRTLGNGSITVDNRIVKVVDNPDADLDAYPYIAISDTTELPLDTFSNFGSEIIFTVHIWTREIKGSQLCKNIMSWVRNVIHRQVIEAAPYTTLGWLVDSARVIKDPHDNRVMHGIMQIRVRTRTD